MTFAMGVRTLFLRMCCVCYVCVCEDLCGFYFELCGFYNLNVSPFQYWRVYLNGYYISVHWYATDTSSQVCWDSSSLTATNTEATDATLHMCELLVFECGCCNCACVQLARVGGSAIVVWLCVRSMHNFWYITIFILRSIDIYQVYILYIIP